MMTTNETTDKRALIVEELKKVGGRIYTYSNYRPSGMEWIYDTVPSDKYTSISISSLSVASEYDIDNLPLSELLFMPNYMNGSDYSGGSVEVSNLRVFLKDTCFDCETSERLAGVWELYGSHGTYGVVISLDSITEEMLSVFRGLDRYPVLDDSDLSEVESESENEAWTSWVCNDFKAELVKQLSDEDDENAIALLSEDNLREIFEAARETSNTYWENETGNNATIDLDRIVAAVDDNRLKTMMSGPK